MECYVAGMPCKELKIPIPRQVIHKPNKNNPQKGRLHQCHSVLHDDNVVDKMLYDRSTVRKTQAGSSSRICMGGLF